jgi:hypothetical protein
MTLERQTHDPENPPQDEVGIQPAESSGAGKPAAAQAPQAEPQQRPLVTMAGLLRGGDLELRNAAVGAIIADEVEVERGFVRTAVAAGELEIEQGGAAVVFSAGPTSIRQGGAQAIVSAGSVTMEQAGGGVVLARQVELRGSGTIVFGVTPRLNVGEGGRVIFGPLPSLIAAGGLVALVAMLISTLRRARGARRGLRR